MQAEPPRRPVRALLAAGIGLVLTASGIVLVRAGGDEAGSLPTPQVVDVPARPSPRSAPAETTEPTPTAPPTPVPGIDEIVAQVADLRGLEPRRQVRSSLVTPGELAAIVSDVAFEEIDPVEIEADQRLLTALRLVPADVDLLDVIEELYREQLVGLYVPSDETLYVRAADAQLSPFEQFTAAHEVVHALQDQAFGLEELREVPDEESDRALAVLALVEGDAVLTQQLWSFRHQTASEREQVRSAALASSGEVLARTPRYIREALAFPYREGGDFVQALHERGGFAAVDAAYADPPTTTAHIYHPEAYFRRQAPVRVELPQTPGPAWEAPRTYTFGEFDLRELMAPLGTGKAIAVGTGWAGGSLRGWQDADATAVAVGLAFDTAANAQQGCDAVPRWFAEAGQGTVSEPGLMTGEGDWMAWSCTDLEVRFGIAPDGETATRLTRPG